MERQPKSAMIRVPTPLVPIVRQLSALYREARQQRDGYDGKREGTRAMLETHMRHDAARDSREDVG